MFFSYDNFGTRFELFTLQHLLAVVLFAVLPCVVIFHFRQRLAGWKHEKTFRIALALFVLLTEFSLYAWLIFAGHETDWRNIAPTTLCGLTIYLGIIALITLNKKIGPVIYFYAFGAFFSFLLADISHGIDRYRFYNFFILHGFIIWSAVYFRAVHKVPLDKKALFRAGAILLPVLTVSFVINYPLDANFFYLNYSLFEDFPVYSQAYAFNKYLYSAMAFASYYILLAAMYLIAKALKGIPKKNPRLISSSNQ